MFRKIDAQQKNQLIYKPNMHFPAQQGPVCHYYTILRCISLENLSVNIVRAKTVENIISDMNALAETNGNLDGLTDDIFRKHLTDHLIQSLQLMPDMNDDDERIETVEDFISNYTNSQMLSLLLGLAIQDNIDPKTMSYEKYINLLKNHGPIIIDGNFGINQISPANTNTITIDSTTFKQHHVDENLCDGQHSVLLIGCQKNPTTQVHYLDPNFPDVIQTMSLVSFKGLITNYGDQLACSPKHTIPAHTNWQTSVAAAAPKLHTARSFSANQ